MRRKTINECFARQIIPVVWELTRDGSDEIAHASTVFLQGGTLGELAPVLEQFRAPHLNHLAVFVHIDLINGLENNEAGLEFLAGFERISGVVSIHHHLAAPARKLGLLSIVRLFLSDSRAVERGLAVSSKAKPDAIEILPAAVAPKVAADFRTCPIPRITGGLCRTEPDVREALESGCLAVTSTRPVLWRLNRR